MEIINLFVNFYAKSFINTLFIAIGLFISISLLSWFIFKPFYKNIMLNLNKQVNHIEFETNEVILYKFSNNIKETIITFILYFSIFFTLLMHSIFMLVRQDFSFLNSTTLFIEGLIFLFYFTILFILCGISYNYLSSKTIVTNKHIYVIRGRNNKKILLKNINGFRVNKNVVFNYFGPVVDIYIPKRIVIYGFYYEKLLLDYMKSDIEKENLDGQSIE